MNHYKSWSNLSKQLNDNLCTELRNRISYFLTRYHDVHNSYGRAAISLDGKEIALFSWIEMYHQENAVAEVYKTHKDLSWEEVETMMKPTWDENCTYCEMDFLDAVVQYRNMTVQNALISDNYIIKIFAIMDRRIGKRTIDNIKLEQEYKLYPEWVQQFYELRFAVSKI